MKKVLLIIPAYNEQDNIVNVYKKISNYDTKHLFELNVIFINDCSKDSTAFILDSNDIPHIDLIHNLGIGGAVQTGYKYAKDKGYDVAVQFDGDGQHDINYLYDLIKPILEDKADFVIGSRFADEKTSAFKSSFARRVGINLISSVIRFVTGKKIYDTTSGFRAANKEIICHFADMYPKEYPEPITNARLIAQGFRVDEIPVNMNERQAGESSIKAWKNFYYMINVILSILIIKKRGNVNVK